MALAERKASSIWTQSQLNRVNRALLTVAVFSLAGYLSAQLYISYSAWVDSLFNAVYQKYPLRSPTDFGYDQVKRDQDLYNAKMAIDKYAVRKWAIFCLGFPVALTLAFLVARVAGWLRHIDLGLGIAGLIPLYFMPGPLLVLSGATWFLLTLPCLVVAAVVLALSLKIMTSRWSTKLLFGFLLSCAFSCLWGASLWKFNSDMAWNVFFVSLEIFWAGIFGLGLALPPKPKLQPVSPGAPPMSPPISAN